MIGRPAKNTLAKIAATATAGMATILSTVRMAFAASTGTTMPPEYAEILRLAQQKVQAATQPGAIGNGVPLLNNLNIDPASVLPWIGIGEAAGIAAAVAAKLLTQDAKSAVLAAQ